MTDQESDLSSQEGGIGPKRYSAEVDEKDPLEATDEDEETQDEEEEDEDLTEDDEEEDSSIDSLNLDPYDESNLPEYSCRYCGIHDPAAVAKCVETKKMVLQWQQLRRWRRGISLGKSHGEIKIKPGTTASQ